MKLKHSQQQRGLLFHWSKYKRGAIVNSVFAASAGTTTITLSFRTLGDWFEITSDGTSYFINGVHVAAWSVFS